ncbi:MAG TPA: nucleotidyl transferase AbiEii/AbiGii toxin family protein [Syntrophorhabdales bacterium]|nr:nucleotidyl transferase AbiEii/AbiGii toxin family protein [Syntrophorhabdales bacterium]
MELFRNIFSCLNRKSVTYLVAGGVAVNLYGIERATADLDIVVLLEKSNLERFVEAIRELALKPKLPVKLEDFVDDEKRGSWLTEKNMKVFSLYDPQNPFFLLDVLIEAPFDIRAMHSRRKELRFEDTVIPVVAIQDLIAMKEASDRPQDRADVFHLRKIIEEWKDG